MAWRVLITIVKASIRKGTYTLHTIQDGIVSIIAKSTNVSNRKTYAINKEQHAILLGCPPSHPSINSSVPSSIGTGSPGHYHWPGLWSGLKKLFPIRVKTVRVITFLLGSLVLVFPSFYNGPYVTSSRRYVTSLPTSRVIRLVRLLLAVGECVSRV